MRSFDIENPFAASNLKLLMWRTRSIFGPYLFWRIVSVVVVVPFPIVTQKVIDDGLAAGDLRLCLLLAGISLCLLALHIFAMTKCVKRLSNTTQALITAMRGRIFSKLQFMHFGFLDSIQTGRLLSKYAFDTQNVEMAVVPMVSSVIPELLRSSLLIIALAFLNPWVLVFIAFAIPIVAFSRIVFLSRLEKTNEVVRLARERLTGQANEFFSAIKLVRGFGQEHPVEQDMRTISSNYGDVRRAQMELNQTFSWVMFSLFSGIEILVVAVGAVMVINGQFSLGVLVALVGSLPVILSPVNILTQFSIQYMQGQESYRSIKELVDSGYVEKWNGTQLPNPMEGRIELRNVSFKYDRTENWALRNLNLTILPGQHIAFVGASGSGKSTVVNLILGLYPPTEGEILIDGIAQSDLAVRAFRRRCAIVMQDNLLLSGSIGENLRFAKPDATDEEVVEACRIANAWSFVEKLPEGLQTTVGERGVSLSGGQRQRIAIARAVLRNPVLLILDEATSALDNESESIVQEALERVAKARTTVTIAHRLSTVRQADVVVVLKDGHVIETGSYADLEKKVGGAFSELLRISRSETPGAA